MKVASIFPKEESEKAISNYTKQLIKSQKQRGIDVTPIMYTAGKASTLRKQFSDLKEYDVVHIQHEYNLLGGYGLPFFELYDELEYQKKKVITTMHNVLSQNEEFKSGRIKTFLRKLLYRKQNKVIGKVSDKIIVHANFFKKILVDEYNLPEEKIIVLPQGIREDVELIDKARAKKELDLEGPVHLIIGSLIPDHGADIIINQAERIRGTILIVANSKSLNDRNDTRVKDWLKYNKDLVKEKGLKNVRFDIKDLPYDLWWKYFAAADIVLLPYKGGIGSGIFADCIATNKPMVGSNIPYFQEFAKDWGFIKIAENEEDYVNKIEEIISEDDLKNTLDFNMYKQKYGLTALANRYNWVYRI